VTVKIPPRRLGFWTALALVTLALAGPGSAAAQTYVARVLAEAPPGPDADEPPGRQVTLFAVVASANDPRIDPRLVKVSAQLKKLLPGHGFRLLAVQTKRLTEGQGPLTCDLGDGVTAATTLVNALDDNGKVQLRCALLVGPAQATHLETTVSTPPNQLFFCEKTLPSGQQLLIGVGAR
jgi:hypothetical protein